MYEKLEEYIDNLFGDNNTPKNQLKDWAYGAIDFSNYSGLITDDERRELEESCEIYK